jgi:REP element-mobilizing transposase RayT
MHIAKRQGVFLPHWTAEGATYAVTFRQNDSLPFAARTELLKLRAELEELKEKATGLKDLIRVQHAFSSKSDAFLNAGYGSCVFRDERHAMVMATALKHFDGTRYELSAWVVMPNHVHAVVRPLPGFKLSYIVKSWKCFSARKLNERIGTSGAFWQREYYDHIVRGELDMQLQIDYVMSNPSTAGLKEWRWVWRKG